MKYRFDKKALTAALAYFCATFSMLEVSLWLSELSRQSRLFRYVQQGTYVITVILAFIAANKLRKLIPKTLRRAFTDGLLKAARAIARGMSKVSQKLLAVFGIDISRKRATKVKDEKSFVFDIQEMNVFKKLMSFKGLGKWRDISENADKIRFIYTKYIIRRVKKGYKHSPSLTPCEVRDELEVEPEQSDFELFDMYNGARYSGGSVNISDEQVMLALSAVGKGDKDKNKD